MATLQSDDRQTSRDAILLSAERHVSHFPCREIDEDWMMDAVNSRCDSLRLWLASVHDGSYGKTCQMRLKSTEEGPLPVLFKGWQNAGMAWRGECWTLDISESPNVAAVCLLSDIVDPNALGRCYLSRDQVANMLRRLKKYGHEDGELAKALTATLSDGQETKRRKRDSS
jgi:hypothetical protein